MLEKSAISLRDNPLTVRDASHGPLLSVVILAIDDVGRPGGPTDDISQICFTVLLQIQIQFIELVARRLKIKKLNKQ